MKTVSTDIETRFASISASLIQKAKSDEMANRELIRLLFEAVKPIIKYLDKPHRVSVFRGKRSTGIAMAEKLEETSRRGIVVATIWSIGPKRDGLYLVFTRKRVEVWIGGATEEEVGVESMDDLWQGGNIDKPYYPVYIKRVAPEYTRYPLPDISPHTQGETEIGYSIDPRLIDPKQLIESVQTLLLQYVQRMQQRLQTVIAYKNAVTSLI